MRILKVWVLLCCLMSRVFFVKDPDLKYIGGELHAQRNLDLDYWSYFEALSLAKEFDSTIKKEGVRLRWKPADSALDNNLELLKVDIDAVEMGGYAIEHNTEVDLFVEYNVNQFEVVDCPVCIGIAEETVDKGKNVHKGKDVDKGNYVEKRKAMGKGKNVDKGQAEDSEDSDYYPSDTSEDSVEGIWFDDSDEEFVMGLDDCFEKEVVVDDAECSQLPRSWRLFEENFEPIPVPAEIDAMHPIENEYLTDELDSASDDDSDPNNAPRAMNQKFAPKELNKDCKFTVRMEFNTLGQFKDAIFEHNVLNGKEVEFIKNDKGGVRFRCTSNDTLKGFNGAVEKAVETIQSPVKNSPLSKEAVDQILQVLLRGLAKFNANIENINEDDSTIGPAT